MVSSGDSFVNTEECVCTAYHVYIRLNVLLVVVIYYDKKFDMHNVFYF